jgi:hypothetical protein
MGTNCSLVDPQEKFAELNKMPAYKFYSIEDINFVNLKYKTYNEYFWYTEMFHIKLEEIIAKIVEVNQFDFEKE